MQKIYLTLSLLVLISYSCYSQSQFSTGASFNLGFPTGSFSDIAKTGIGGTAIFEYNFIEKLSAILSASYQNFPGNSEGIAVQGMVIDFSVNSIPVMAGVRYYFSNEFFGTAEAGVNLLRVSADIYDVYTEKKVSTDYQTKYAGEVGAGYRYKLAEASAFEFIGLYQFVEDDFNSIVLRLGLMIFLDHI